MNPLRIILLVAFLIYSNSAISDEPKTTMQCYFAVAGHLLTPPQPDAFVAIDKPCVVTSYNLVPDSLGSVFAKEFTWIVNGESEHDYFLYLYKDSVSGASQWSINWNGDPASTHAQSPLGDDFMLRQLTDSGACLNNRDAMLCLHNVGEVPRRAEIFMRDWWKWRFAY